MSETTTLTPAATRPAHVPDTAYYDFDMFQDTAYLADPHNRVLDLVENAPPIFWTPRNGGHWMFLSHAANFQGSRDYETFTSQFATAEQLKMMLAAMPPGTPRIPQAVPINLDPPQHGQYRAPLNAVFSPKSMMALKDDIRAIAVRLVEAIDTSASCEFMSAVAEQMPVEVFLKMFGLPLSRQEEYRALVKEHLSESDMDPRKAMMKLTKIVAIMHETLVERRDDPQDDIISLLWRTEVDGKPTTMEDMENYCVLLFIAGLDTVVNGMGHGVRHMALNPGLQDELRANPKLIPEAAEEILRRYTFTVPVRKVAKDTEFQGVDLKAGERVALFLPAADLDPSEYPEPERYDLKRENNVHIAFGTGPHRCLGSHLARIELQVLYEEMLARLPKWRLDPASPPTFHGGHVMGPLTVDILFDA